MKAVSSRKSRSGKRTRSDASDASVLWMEKTVRLGRRIHWRYRRKKLFSSAFVGRDP
jgi:hypothetical protein